MFLTVLHDALLVDRRVAHELRHAHRGRLARAYDVESFRLNTDGSLAVLASETGKYTLLTTVIKLSLHPVNEKMFLYTARGC